MEQDGLIAARALVYLLLLPAAGLPLYALTALRVAPVSTAIRRMTGVLAVLAGLASIWWVVASVSAMAATRVAELDRETIMVVAGATPLGMVLVVRLAALAILAATILWPRVPLALPVLAGLAALATAAFTGHAGASEGTTGLVHRIADAAHLAAGACWLAALLRFVAGSFGGGSAQAAAARLARFAATGTVIVAILAVTGLANLVLIAGPGLPPPGPWSWLLVAKLGLFAAMLGLAAANRWRLTPALERGDPGAERRLRLSLAAELGCAIGVVALVAALGVVDPAGS